MINTNNFTDIWFKAWDLAMPKLRYESVLKILGYTHIIEKDQYVNKIGDYQITISIDNYFCYVYDTNSKGESSLNKINIGLTIEEFENELKSIHRNITIKNFINE